jgi:hypothetical protein
MFTWLERGEGGIFYYIQPPEHPNTYTDEYLNTTTRRAFYQAYPKEEEEKRGVGNALYSMLKDQL